MREIKNYLNNRSINEMALLLTGLWGYGKTFYTMEVVNAEQERASISKIYYITLNGITSLNSIDEQVIAQKLKIDSKAGKVAAGVLKAATRMLIRNNGQADAKAGDFSDLNWNDVITFKNALFVVDDLERCPLEIEKVLGYIHSNYLQGRENSNRVIYICNEEEISEVQKAVYKAVKEKYIGWTVAFRPNFGDAAKAIFSEYADLKGKVDIDAIISWCEELEAYNLRTFRFYLNTLSVIEQFLPEDGYSRAIFNYSMLVVSIHYKAGVIESGVQMRDLPDYLHPVKAKEHPADVVMGEADPSTTEKIRLLYNNPRITHEGTPLPFTVSQQLLDLVTSLTYLPEKFREHTLKLERNYANRFMTENIRAARKLYQFDFLKTDEYREIRDRLLKGVEENTMDVIDLIAVMKLLRSLSAKGEEFTGISPQYYQDLENLIVADDYSFFLLEGDQRGAEYDFFTNVCDLVHDNGHPLYIKFRCFFEMHQKIEDYLSGTKHDFSATLILDLDGLWSDKITEYLREFDEQALRRLLDTHKDNHTFWVNLDRYFNHLDLSEYCDADKEPIYEHGKVIEEYAKSMVLVSELSEKMLYTRLSNCRRGVKFQ